MTEHKIIFFYSLIPMGKDREDRIKRNKFLREFGNFHYPLIMLDMFDTNEEKLKEFIEHGDN